MESDTCRLCNAALTSRYVFKEMMFGMQDEFAYAGCPNCGSIQILQVPQQLDQYYPPYYCSFTQQVPRLKRQPFLKRMAGGIRMRRKYKKRKNTTLELIKPAKTLPGARILDIGCGKGELICKLFNLGFEHVTGVDKFIGNEIDHGFGVKVLKKELSELQSKSYNLLIMHHVLEHVDDQVNELNECRRLLKTGGILLVVLPVLGQAWDVYHENWVQLDAPRHFVLHTQKSMKILAQRTGFSIQQTIYDSTAFQFLGSELYKKGIPLTLPETHEWQPFDKIFSKEQIAEYTQKADYLNSIQQGDSARFYLRKN